MVLTIVIFVPYIRALLKGTYSAHVFTWIIWSITTLVVFVAQLSEGGGVGAWPTGLSALTTIIIAVIAFAQRQKVAIRKFDGYLFISALASVPLWYVFDVPLYSVMLLTVVDLIGFIPTIKKAYKHPYSESLWFYSSFLVRTAISIFALEAYNATTLIFPVVISLACLVTVIIISVFRRIKPTPAD